MRNDGSRARFDFTTITLHWLTATLITFQAATGLTLEFARDSVPTLPLLDFHRSAGTMVWFVALMRVVWRGTFAKFPPFPEWMSNAQKWLATKIEYLLYGLLLLQPLTGLATTLLLGEPFHLFFWTVPPLVHRNLDLSEPLFAIHRVGAYCLFAVVGGHAGMALLHHYVVRDEVLERMAPWVRKKSNPSATKAAETWATTSRVYAPEFGNPEHTPESRNGAGYWLHERNRRAHREHLAAEGCNIVFTGSETQ